MRTKLEQVGSYTEITGRASHMGIPKSNLVTNVLGGGQTRRTCFLDPVQEWSKMEELSSKECLQVLSLALISPHALSPVFALHLIEESIFIVVWGWKGPYRSSGPAPCTWTGKTTDPNKMGVKTLVDDHQGQERKNK